jgi:DNA-binding NarL/FixJ family response regulator
MTRRRGRRRLENEGLRLLRFGRGSDEYLVLSVPIPVTGSLTAAEHDVFERILAGCSNAEIAHARGTSVRTVAVQVAAILRKSGAQSRSDLAAKRARGK